MYFLTPGLPPATSYHRVPLARSAQVRSYSVLGPWLEAGGVVHLPLSSSWYLNGAVVLAYARNSNDKKLDYDADGVQDLNTDQRSLLALPPRAMLGLRLNRLRHQRGPGVSARCAQAACFGATRRAAVGALRALHQRQQR